MEIIGRKKEQQILQQALQSSEAEMIAVIGRRRVGKTFLVQSVYKNQLVFEITGIHKATRSEQLRNFTHQLQLFSPTALVVSPPSDWLAAFFMLISYLKQLDRKDKIVVFFDELPWLASHKSGFLKGLSYFWNSWAVKQHIVVVICGSAASWMIRKVINSKGGLYNRLTRRILLKPFSLAETEAYLQSRHLHLNRYHITQLYMALGGIPHYLKEISAGKSAAQNIQEICFSDLGLLNDEFNALYPALFEDADRHIAVIRALAQKKQGLTRAVIIQLTGLSNGGSTTKVLEELIYSGFVTAYPAFKKKKKEQVYRLTDEYSLFYLQFMEKKEQEGKLNWQNFSQTQAYQTWTGYAFESICLKHVDQIKKVLGISGVYATTSTFYQKGNDDCQGVQIDLLIDRNDQVINVVEIKFYNTLFVLTKNYAQRLREKMAIFQAITQTRKQLFITLATTFGILPNKHSTGFIEQVVTLDDLFEG